MAVAFAGTDVEGIDGRWQDSQASLVGMCAAELPAGVRGGITMILLMPVNDETVIAEPWQPAQVVMPAWFIVEPANTELSCTVPVTLEPGPTWQLSHACAVGMCLTVPPAAVWVMDVIRKFTAGIAKLAACVVPWHCTQLVVWLGA